MMAARNLATGEVVTKVIDYDPERPARTGRASIQGLLTYLVDGDVVFVARGAAFTNIRTAAMTSLAVDLLAPQGSRVLTIFGAGPQAYAHALAVGAVRAFDEIRLVSKSGASAERLASRLGPMLTAQVRGVQGERRACAGADVVITATSAVDPFLTADDIDDGALVAAIGSGIRGRAELSGSLVARARTVVVETIEAARSEGGDLIRAEAEGSFDWRNVVQIADVLAGGLARDDNDVVIYKSVGSSWQDLACARVIAENIAPAG